MLLIICFVFAIDSAVEVAAGFADSLLLLLSMITTLVLVSPDARASPNPDLRLGGCLCWWSLPSLVAMWVCLPDVSDDILGCVYRLSEALV